MRGCYPKRMLLMVAYAFGGVVTDVPPGESRVDLVVCPTETPCAEMAYQIEQIPGESFPILPFDVLLELDGGEWEDGEKLGARFDAAMDRARDAWAKGRVDDASRALDDAEAALRRWSGTPDNQRLFDLPYLRGAVAIARKEDPEADFRQAAAIAWNRTVTLPVEDPTAKAWYATLEAVLKDGTGTLKLADPPPGSVWYLDGVELSGSPATVQVFPGVHRVTVHHERMIRTWKRDVQVQARRSKDVTAVFSPADDAAWVRGQVRDAFSTERLPKEVMELVSTWCARKNVSVVRFVRVDEGGRLQVVTYDAALRRVGPG